MDTTPRIFSEGAQAKCGTNKKQGIWDVRTVFISKLALHFSAALYPAGAPVPGPLPGTDELALSRVATLSL